MNVLSSPIPVLSLNSSPPKVLIDSGAALSVVSTSLSPYIQNLHSTSSYVATAADGQGISLQAEGSLGPLSHVMVSEKIRHNCISVSHLCDLNYEIIFTKSTVSIVHPGGVLNGIRSDGLYYFPIDDFLSLSFPPALMNIGSKVPDIDHLDLWHRRLADTSHKIIREAVRNKLIEGVTLDRKYFTKRGRSKYRCPCDVCSRAKMHKISFPAVRDRLSGLFPGAYMSADVLIMQNIPSREGYCYVLFIVDHASKMSWVFPMVTREASVVITHLQTFMSDTLPSLNVSLKHFHTDGGAELIAKEVLQMLHSYGVTTTHYPRDTPQMNSVTERWVRSLKEKVLCMLLRSSLPVAFWWYAVQCGCYLLNRVPTKTVHGHMTPYECIFNIPPDLKWLRIWGCKCYVLKPIAERKKDFDDKAYSGFLVGYGEQNTGYLVFVPELNKAVVSVHVVFNEIIPDPTSEYFAELDRLQIEVAADAKDPQEYSFLVGSHHLDDEDGMVYETTRVAVRKGFIVAFRRLVTDSVLKPREEATPIHIADVNSGGRVPHVIFVIQWHQLRQVGI